MKRIFMISTLAATVLLAACGQKTEQKAPAAADAGSEAAPSGTMAGNMTGDMGNMAMATNAPIMAKGHGTVTAVDKTAGTITLDHGPIPEAKWPAMTMAFKAAPAILDTVKVGEKVDFDLTLTGNAGEVTAIHKQP